MKTEQIILTSIASVLAFLIIGGIIGSYSYGTSDFDYRYGMMGNFFMGAGFMWMFGLIFMTLLTVALVLLIIWLAKQIGKK